MLAELSIRNVAIIEQLQLAFGSGLNLLTGETGAGKSIIIDSLALATGGRASNELIRTGEDEASVEAVFMVKGRAEIAAFLDQAGIASEDELLIKRIISRGGRNRCFINGSIATQTQLAELGRRLVTIHGQHESQELLKPENHLQLLDSFAGTVSLRLQFQRLFEKWQLLNGQLEGYDRDELDTARQLDLLSFQAMELDAADFKSGEDEELVSRHQILASAEKLSTLTGNAFERLYGDDDAVLAALRKIASAVSEAAAIDQRLAQMAKVLDESYLQIEDAALELRSYLGQIEFDQDGLRAVDERLDLINRMKKKYGTDLDGLIALRVEIEAQLEQLRDRSCSREELAERVNVAKEELTAVGRQLSAARTEAAARLSDVLADEASQLAMKHAVVCVEVVPLENPRATGFDKIEFLFSPNPGETPRPLGRVASGGELSRLMLAFKQVLPEGEAPTMVFDEVDTGVGGAVAGVIGRKLANVAKGQQVFCITHLPQVAAFAAHHLKVEKLVENGRTVTAVRELDQKLRVEEIARMLAGEKITDAARKHAAELISQKD